MYLISARRLLEEGRYSELLAFIVREAANIESSAEIRGLRPWFDIRGVVAFIRIVFAEAPNRGDLYANLVAAHPEFRSGLVAAAVEAMQTGLPGYAIELLDRAQAPRPDDIFVQDLLVRAYMALNGTRGGQAPPENWAGRYCSRPFEHFEPLENGEVFVCSPLKLPFSIGNIYAQSIEEIWNSPTAQAIRDSILDGSFRYCSKQQCGYLMDGTLPLLLEEGPPPPGTPPQVVVMNHDRSCNLSCPSCRTEKYVAGQAERERLDKLRPDLVELASQAERVIVTNAGDPFASKHYRQFLQEMRPRPDQELTLYTNALLFTPREWEKLSHLHSIRVSVEVSIDAAVADTYHELRRGGSFDRLKENLNFISELRRTDRVARLGVNMTVQARNFREMPEFVAWGRELAADCITFLRLRNWGTYSTEEYLARDVCSPSHPLHAELMRILALRDFHSAPVDLGSLPRPPRSPSSRPFSGWAQSRADKARST